VSHPLSNYSLVVLPFSSTIFTHLHSSLSYSSLSSTVQLVKTENGRRLMTIPEHPKNIQKTSKNIQKHPGTFQEHSRNILGLSWNFLGTFLEISNHQSHLLNNKEELKERNK